VIVPDRTFVKLVPLSVDDTIPLPYRYIVQSFIWRSAQISPSIPGTLFNLAADVRPVAFAEKVFPLSVLHIQYRGIRKP